MGKLNLIKGAWTGKVGELVGAKWKATNTLHSFTKPSNPNTAAQQAVRTPFGEMTAFVSLFAEGIKYLSSLNTRNQSVRNAIIQLNKTQISGGAFNPATLQVNKGGLPQVAGFTATASTGGVSCTWTPPTASNISANAVVVVVAVDKENLRAATASKLASGGATALVVETGSPSGAKLDVYAYLIDKRGSYKAGSNSQYATVTLA